MRNEYRDRPVKVQTDIGFLVRSGAIPWRSVSEKFPKTHPDTTESEFESIMTTIQSKIEKHIDLSRAFSTKRTYWRSWRHLSPAQMMDEIREQCVSMWDTQRSTHGLFQLFTFKGIYHPMFIQVHRSPGVLLDIQYGLVRSVGDGDRYLEKDHETGRERFKFYSENQKGNVLSPGHIYVRGQRT